jgi:copper chaperone CopZ
VARHRTTNGAKTEEGNAGNGHVCAGGGAEGENAVSRRAERSVRIATPEGRGGWQSRQPLRFAGMVSVLTISGMVAVHSKRAVFTALSGVPGVISADVEMGRAVVEHDVATTADAMASAVAIVGCEVTSVRVERRLPLSG